MAKVNYALVPLLIVTFLVISGYGKVCPDRSFNFIFVIDSSNSIAESLYPENFEFIDDFIDYFEIGDTKTRVALITFGSHPRLIFNNTGDEALINKHLRNTPKHQKSSTQTGRALWYVIEQGLAGEERPGVDTIVYLVTDGKSSNHRDTIKAANSVKRKGYIIVSIGVGDRRIDLNELEEVATTPLHVVQIADYIFLQENANIAKDICRLIKQQPVPTSTLVPPTPEPPTPEPCPEDYFNLVFVIDSSNSIRKKLYPNNFEFVRLFLANFFIGEKETRVALITFGTHPRLIFNNTGDEDFIYEKLDDVPFQGSSTQTARALRFVDEQNLVGEDRQFASIVILVTDGKSVNPKDTALAANELKDKGYIIMCVGVGKKVKVQELNDVASKPEYVFMATDYERLPEIAEKVSTTACHTDTAAETIEETVNETGSGSSPINIDSLHESKR